MSHTVLPVPEVKVPGSHNEQAVAPVPEKYCPAGQLLHTKTLFTSEYVPFSHNEQFTSTVEVHAVSIKDPALHVLQAGHTEFPNPVL